MKFLLSILFIGFLSTCAFGLDNGLGLTPQMGWNSWNKFACGINEELIKETAAAMVSSGLVNYGYNYVNMDDCWASYRDANGDINPDPTAFPSGIKALADYVHSLGLKFGLYSDAGTETCAGRPGSLNFEKNDANTYASWTVDYLKYDNCNNQGIKPEERYPIMQQALNQTNRPIFFSLCEWGVDNPATWAPAVGNSWRTTGDISASWTSMMLNIDYNDLWAKYAGPGAWNDPDMLEVGNSGLSLTESMTHFSLWSLTKAPLIIGCDVRNISAEIYGILTATEVIAVNQDSLGVQGTKRVSNNNLEVWAGPLSDGSVAAVLLNRSNATATITANFSDIGIANGATATANVRDLWARVDLGSFTGSYSATVVSHGSVMVKVSSS